MTTDWLDIATRPTVVRRALKYALIVGTLLIVINHGDAILRGDISVSRLIEMGLTTMVPYAVSTLSSVEALRSAERETAPRQ
jgi:hypothetical protein